MCQPEPPSALEAWTNSWFLMTITWFLDTLAKLFPGGDDHYHDQVGDTGAEDGHDHNPQRHGGDRHGNFRCPHHNIVNHTAEIPREHAKERADHLRIDTHQDNLPMQGAIAKAGFKRAGIVYVSDGTPRVAFDWLREA